MSDDAIPAFLRLTQEQRSAAWALNPPRSAIPSTAVVRDVDATTQAFLNAQQETTRLKSTARIQKLKAKKDAVALDLTGKRWDARNNKWVKESEHVTRKTRGKRKQPKRPK